MIEIGENNHIQEKELTFVASRSGGPGGQNVNKVSTKVTLFFQLDQSTSLSEEQKERIRERLSTRVSRDGFLRVASQRHRSQSQNRRAPIERFSELVEEALSDSPPRRKTQVPATTKRRRLQEKLHRARIKQVRSKPVDLDE